MESMTACRQRVQELRCQAGAQVRALAALREVLAHDAKHIHRQDDVECIDDLAAKVAQEVGDIRWLETAESYEFSKERLISGLMKFTLGSLTAAVSRRHGNPLVAGAQMARSEFHRTATFGAVMVAVGPGGVPDDVYVVPLSRQARELGRSEPEIIAALKTKGYRLMTPESFCTALDRLKEKLLKGSLTLPVAASSLENHNESLSRAS